MINLKILQNIIQPHRIFINTLTNNKFVITKIEDQTVHCRAFTKLKRGAAVSQVNFTLNYNLFVSYLEDSMNKPATFKVLE